MTPQQAACALAVALLSIELGTFIHATGELRVLEDHPRGVCALLRPETLGFEDFASFEDGYSSGIVQSSESSFF